MVSKGWYVFLALFVCILIVWFVFQWLHNPQPEIPEIALNGIKPHSQKSIAYFELGDWSDNFPSEAFIAVFSGELLSTGEEEIRAFGAMGKDASPFYLGALSSGLQLSGVKTNFVDFGTERCVVGWVSPAIKKPYLFRIENAQEQSSHKILRSTIEGGVFIVPIKEDVSTWNTLSFSGVQTTGSLQRGNDDIGSWYEVEKTYSPPFDVSGWYVHVPVQ